MSLSPTPTPSSLRPDPPSRPDTSTNDDLELTIRFSASLADLHLSLPGSLYANTATLKQLIRSRIPSEYTTRRIRLIHAGKALVDDVPLQISLRSKNRVGGSKVPSRIGTPVGPYGRNADANAPGSSRAAVGSSETGLRPDSASTTPIYIHCSIGDVELSAADLAEETAIAQRGADESEQDGVPFAANPSGATGAGAGTGSGTTYPGQNPSTTTTPAPRGFDRLHSAGFTAAEITSLRLQFLAIQAHTHTPDTMPSPNTLRNMEDRWLDGSNAHGAGTGTSDGAVDVDGAIAASGSAGGGGGGGGIALDATDDDGQAGALDDMVWGTVMGFFWPIGCLMWGVREEGIWSQRRKMAVVVGVLLNVGLGIIRYTG